MSGGVFAISRGLLDHEIFADEPFTEREAFIWLVGEAAWKERRVRVGRALITLQRGQCAYALRFLADRWKWSVGKVRRFLEKLKNDAMIDTQTDTLATRITICNYDKYQKVSMPSGTLDDTQTDEPAAHSRHKEKDRGNKERDSVANATGDAAAPPSYPTDPVERLWSEGLDLLGCMGVSAGKARPIVGRWMRDARNDAGRVLDAIRRAHEHGTEDPVPLVGRILKPITQGKRDETSLSAHARNLTERIEAAQRGQPLFAFSGEPGSGDPVRMLPDRRGGGT